MPSFLVSDAEWEALFDEPHHLLKVYCAIRMHMDYSTAISGESRRLSEQMLIEVLSIPASPGRPAHKATRKEVRYAVDALVRRGLLEPMGSIGPFVFHLPKAERDNSVSGRWGQRFARGGARPGALGGADGIYLECPDFLACSDIDASGGARGGARGSSEVGPEVGPTSGLPPKELPTSLLPRTSHDPPNRFPMHDAWIPSPRGWPAALVRIGMQGFQLRDDDLLEFRSYWVNRPEKYQSQGQWEHELAKDLKRKNRYDQTRSSHGQPLGSAGPAQGQAGHRAAQRGYQGRQGHRSAQDHVRDAIAERDAREAAEQVAGSVLVEDD